MIEGLCGETLDGIFDAESYDCERKPGHKGKHRCVVRGECATRPPSRRLDRAPWITIPQRRNKLAYYKMTVRWR